MELLKSFKHKGSEAGAVFRVESELKRTEELFDAVIGGRIDGTEFRVSAFDRLISPLVKAGGKRLRARLVLLVAGAGQELFGTSDDARQVCEASRIRMAAAVELLHLATLIHDDVLDGADLRRGTETIHRVHGDKVAILSGDYVFSRAFALLADIGEPRLLSVLAGTVGTLTEGEFMQAEDYFRTDVSIERYLEKTEKKTACFIRDCMEVGALLGGWSQSDTRALKAYGYALGMMFQLTDDVMDYRERTETTGKPVGHDVREGVLTHPLLSVVTRENRSVVDVMIEDIRNGGETDTLSEFVVRSGGIDNTLALAADYGVQAVSALEALPDFAGKGMLRDAVHRISQRKV